jgi:hypothetical protein
MLISQDRRPRWFVGMFDETKNHQESGGVEGHATRGEEASQRRTPTCWFPEQIRQVSIKPGPLS